MVGLGLFSFFFLLLLLKEKKLCFKTLSLRHKVLFKRHGWQEIRLHIRVTIHGMITVRGTGLVIPSAIHNVVGYVAFISGRKYSKAYINKYIHIYFTT